MRINVDHLKEFLPNLNWSLETLATNLSMIGHEAEVENGNLEIKVFPNRGDVLSLRGLARDIAALYPEVGRWQEVETLALPTTAQFFPLTITNEAKSLINADHLLKISGYKATKSPPEIVEKLQTMSLQPKDLLIDLTNIVAYEIGVPLHAFDFNKVQAGMTIDLSKSGELFTALSQKRVELTDDLLIARNTEGDVVDLLGTIGGQHSAIDASTTEVLVQAAALNGATIRKNSRTTGLRTEASYRYERGVDPKLMSLALARFAYWMKKILPAAVVESYQAMDNLLPEITISVEPHIISRLLGLEVSRNNLDNLSRLGFKVSDNQITAPSWRFDIAFAVDIAEEVARMIGYNTIKPKQLETSKPALTGEYEKQLSIKNKLSQVGFHETLTYSFSQAGTVKIQNPRTEADSYLRATLRDGLFKTLARNPYLSRVGFFEIGSVFNPEEATKLGIILTGVKESQLEARAQEIGQLLGVEINLQAIGQDELDRFDVKQRRVYFTEIDCSQIKVELVKPTDRPLNVFKSISKFPPVVRDVTFVVDKSVEAATIGNVIKDADLVLIAELVDSYQSEEAIGSGKIALTFRILLQNLERSLTDDEATETLNKVFQKLSETVKYEIR